MKMHGLISITAALLLSASQLSAEGRLFAEIGIGASAPPNTSTRTIYGFLGAGEETLPVDPETFSQANVNMEDKYLYVGYLYPLGDGASNVPLISDIGLEFGLRAHHRKGVTYEADFTARFRGPITKEWDWFLGGAFGQGQAALGFDKVTFETSTSPIVVDFPDKMDYSTGSFIAGASYQINEDVELGFSYEIKENIFDTEDMQRQANFSSATSPLSILAIKQMLTSYRSMTHTAYASLRYKF